MKVSWWRVRYERTGLSRALHSKHPAPHVVLGCGNIARSAGLPTANDIIWDLKVKYYCAEENQDIKAHDINNKAIKSKVQSFLDSRKFPAAGSPEEYSFYFGLVFGDDRAAQKKYIVEALATSKVSLTVGHRAFGALLDSGHARRVHHEFRRRHRKRLFHWFPAKVSRRFIWKARTRP